MDMHDGQPACRNAVSTCSMTWSMDMWLGHEVQKFSMKNQHVHTEWTSSMETWTRSMDKQRGHIAYTCGMFMQNGQAACTWTWSMDLQHGQGYAAWTWKCSVNMEIQLRNKHAALTWTCSMDRDM